MDETRLAIVAIIVEDKMAVSKINEILHSCSSWIIGRMGMPYEKKNVSVITVVIDAPQDIISTLSGKLGQIKNVSIKTTYSRV
jgi:putative iron-only hydrogenase system regulator